MFSIIKFFRGFLWVHLFGFSPERFMNLCNYNGIKIWNVEPYNDGYCFYIYKSDLYKVKNFQKKTGTKVVIRKKLGLPFLLQKYKKRQIFILGLLFSFIILYISTRNVWNFQIYGNRTLTKDQYLQFLSENQIHYGTSKKNIDIDSLNKKIRKQCEYITWASFQLKGTTLCLYVKEEYKEANIYTTENEYGNICAAHDGTIINIITRNGTPMYKIGDTVEKGCVLISGDIPYLNDDESLKRNKCVKADGDVILNYPLTYTDCQPYYVSEKVYTGRTKSMMYLVINDQTIRLNNKLPYKQYDLYEENFSFLLPFYSVIRITIGYYNYKEYTETSKLLNREVAISYIDDRFYDFCKRLSQKGIQIIGKNVKMNYTSNHLEVLVNMIVEQSGGIYVPVNPE